MNWGSKAPPPLATALGTSLLGFRWAWFPPPFPDWNRVKLSAKNWWGPVPTSPILSGSPEINKNSDKEQKKTGSLLIDTFICVLNWFPIFLIFIYLFIWMPSKKECSSHCISFWIKKNQACDNEDNKLYSTFSVDIRNTYDMNGFILQIRIRSG